MDDQKNFVLAIALSALLFVAYSVFYAGPKMAAENAARAAAAEMEAAAIVTPENPVTVAVETPDAVPSIRIPIRTEAVEGSFQTRGFRLDDLKLLDYDATLADDSGPVALLVPEEAEGDLAAYVSDNWGVVDGASGANADWTLVSGSELTESTPVVLAHEGPGFRVERTVRAADRFLFEVTDRVTNTSGAPINLERRGLSRQIEKPEGLTNFFILQEGPIAFVDNSLTDLKYSKIEKERRQIEAGDAGWAGLTDKYWLAAAVAPEGTQIEAEFAYQELDGRPVYDASYQTAALTLTPGTTVESKGFLFTGAKERALLERLEDDFGIPELNRAIDWGTLRILVKPLTTALNWLGGLIGNFGVAIVVLTLLIKIVLFPLYNKQYKSMAKMKKVAPQLTKLRERYSAPEDRMQLQQEMMALYKKEGANPISGCLPLIPTIFVFFALYKTVLIDTELRHAPFFGYIQDLSAREGVNVLNLFGLLPYDVPAVGLISFIAIGPLAILYGISMAMMQTLNPTASDPTQRKIFMALPWVFMFVLAPFAAGLLVYWVASNIFSFLQSYFIYKRMGAEIPLETWIKRKLGREKALPAGMDVLPPKDD